MDNKNTPSAAPAGQHDAGDWALVDEIKSLTPVHGRGNFAKALDHGHYLEGHEEARNAAAELVAELAGGFREGRNTNPGSAGAIESVKAGGERADGAVDYELLLTKYIEHVGAEEGITFIGRLYKQASGQYEGYSDKISFSADEFDALNQCADTILPAHNDNQTKGGA